MASVEAKSIPEIKRFMEDYWKIVKSFWLVEDTDEYWTAVVEAVNDMARAYPDGFCRKMLVTFVDYLEEKCRKEAVEANGNTT